MERNGAARQLRKVGRRTDVDIDGVHAGERDENIARGAEIGWVIERDLIAAGFIVKESESGRGGGVLESSECRTGRAEELEVQIGRCRVVREFEGKRRADGDG